MYRTMMNSETGCKQLSLNAFDSLKKEEVWCEKKKNMKVSLHIFPTHEATRSLVGKERGEASVFGSLMI